jgi:hypothetical protein
MKIGVLAVGQVPNDVLRSLKVELPKIFPDAARKPSCVMHFSNSIVDNDKKENLFCKQDYLHASYNIKNLCEKQ